VPARESLARVLPVGPYRRFSAREPASPGVACSSLVPRRALLASARVVRYAPSESVPRGTQVVSLKLAAHHFRVSHGYNRVVVSLAPSKSVPRGTRAVSAPRAVSWVPVPTQARASATGGCCTGQHVGLGAERTSKEQWRRSETSFPNRLAASRARAWRWWCDTTALQQKGGTFWPENF
jgi:hypothetical protein